MQLLTLLVGLALLAPRPVADDEETAVLRAALQQLASLPMSEDVYRAHEELHRRAWRLGDEPTAREAFARLLEYARTRTADTAAAYADLLTGTGIAAHGLGDLAGARALFRGALDLQESAHGPEHHRVSVALVNLAIVLVALGEFAEARPLYDRALAIDTEVHGAGSTDVATTLVNLAILLRETGELNEARSRYELALQIFEDLHGPDDARVAYALVNLGVVLRELGEYHAARVRLERALAIREALLSPDDALIADTLDNLAIVLWDLGDYAGARPMLERSQRIRRAALGDRHPHVALNHTNLGNLLSDLGDHEAALAEHERALELTELLLGPDHPEVASSLANLAVELDNDGQHGRALPLMERALTIREQAFGSVHPSIAQSLLSLARAHGRLGHPTRARGLLERALEVGEASLGPDHPQVGYTLSNLASLLETLGDRDGARRLYERSLAIREAALGPGHPSVMECLEDLARLCLDEGHPEEALAYARRLELGGDHTRRTLSRLTEGESFLYLATQRRRLEVLLAAAEAAGETGVAYGAVARTKGQVARLTLQLRADPDPETRARTQLLASLDEQLSALALDRRIPDPVAHEARLAALQRQRDALERRVRSLRPITAPPAPTPRQIRGQLPAGAVLVDFVIHGDHDPVDTERFLSAWVLAPGRDVQRVSLGPMEPIERALQGHLASEVGVTGTSRGRPLAGDRGSTATTSSAGPTLRERLWEPLAPHVAGAHTLFISPDGALGGLPFETLRDSRGRFLVEDHAFVYLADASVLVELGSAPSPLGASLLAVGGVDYGGGPPRQPATEPVTRRFGDHWTGLPATLREVEGIVALHDESRSAGERRILIGSEAREARLKTELPRHAVLHLATHGFFQPDGMPSMWDAAVDASRADDGPGVMTRAARRLTGLHPGLLSGLVLAGAQDASGATEPGDDGYLTASEVTGLDLAAVDLVVLSACETGLGRPQSGEGLLGLRRAFHMAGADTVISSLWSVEDASTAELMQAFYAGLLVQGLGRHAALRAAQLQLLERNRREAGDARPHTWGAFVLSGEWR